MASAAASPLTVAVSSLFWAVVVESIRLLLERAERRMSSSMRGVGDLDYLLSRADVDSSTWAFNYCFVFFGSLDNSTDSFSCYFCLLFPEMERELFSLRCSFLWLSNASSLLSTAIFGFIYCYSISGLCSLSSLLKGLNIREISVIVSFSNVLVPIY